jgi:hypothetical protein
MYYAFRRGNMTTFMDGIGLVAENREPITFEEAVKQGIEGKQLVFVSPNQELSERRFRQIRELLPNKLVKECNLQRIRLKDDIDIMFMSEYAVEHGALRGYGKVVWVV